MAVIYNVNPKKNWTIRIEHLFINFHNENQIHKEIRFQLKKNQINPES